jgi:D12 class N6 adenine-specific DNA methyltransferase
LPPYDLLAVGLHHTLIKWTGSKRRQAKQIVAQFPRKIATYYEPFLGSGSVIYELLGTKTSSPLGNGDGRSAEAMVFPTTHRAPSDRRGVL